MEVQRNLGRRDELGYSVQVVTEATGMDRHLVADGGLGASTAVCEASTCRSGGGAK